MSGPGRPNKDEIAQRRQRIRLFLAVSAAASEQAVKRIAEKLGVGERAVRGDLEAIRDEVEHAPSDDLSHDLLAAIEGADTFKLLKALGKKVMHEMVTGTIDRASAPRWSRRFESSARFSCASATSRPRSRSPPSRS